MVAEGAAIAFSITLLASRAVTYPDEARRVGDPNPCAKGKSPMRPFNFWLFGGAFLYNVVVIGIVEDGAFECFTHCISCCHEMLL
jgi:hypothetical protein